MVDIGVDYGGVDRSVAMIRLPTEVRDALTGLGFLGDIHTYETPERMAWVFFVLRVVDERRFMPNGKWATILALKAALDIAAQHCVDEAGP